MGTRELGGFYRPEVIPGRSPGGYLRILSRYLWGRQWFVLPGIRPPLFGLRGGWRRERVNVNIKIGMRNHQPLTVATWNVRTLLDFSEENPRLHRRTAIVAHELKRYNIDIAALSETRLSGEDNLIEKGEGYTFFLEGLPRKCEKKLWCWLCHTK